MINCLKHTEVGLRTGILKRREVQQLIYERDALVVAITRKRAGYRCEVEGCTSPAFLTDDGERYVEAHHLVPLAQGGKDEIENTACLCPTHHREVHHGRSRRDLTASLLAKRMPKVEIVVRGRSFRAPIREPAMRRDRLLRPRYQSLMSLINVSSRAAVIGEGARCGQQGVVTIRNFPRRDTKCFPSTTGR